MENRSDRFEIPFEFNIPWERIGLIVLRGDKERGDATLARCFPWSEGREFRRKSVRGAMTELSTRMDE